MESNPLSNFSEEQASFFEGQGYLIVEDALDGEQLPHVQEAFRRVEEETRSQWKEDCSDPNECGDSQPYGRGPTAHVVYPVVHHDDLFLDLLEHPKTIPIAEAMMGPDVMMSDNALHVKPAHTKSHTEWHKDSRDAFFSMDQWSDSDRRAWEKMGASETPFTKIKIFFFIDDIDGKTAPFSVAPGTHKIDVDRSDSYENLNDMPNHVKLVGKAGTAILWNGAIWHTAMDNIGDNARRMLVFNYVHYGMMQYDVCKPSDELVEKTNGRSPLCRQLLGIERMPRS